MQIPAGLGGPERVRPAICARETAPGVALRPVRDLRPRWLAVELGATIVAEPFDIPDGPTLAAVDDPEGIPLVLVQQ